MTIAKKLVELIFNRNLAVGSISLLIMACASTAQQISNSRIKQGSLSQDCTSIDLELPENFVVYGGSGYTRGDKLPYPIDNSGDVATEIDVAVNSPSQPVVLLLGAYEPTVWDIHWTENTDILAAVAYGGHRQGVAGLPGDIPISINIYTECVGNDSLFTNLDEKYTLNQLSEELFNKPLEQNIFTNDTVGLIFGESIEEGSNLVSSDDTPVKSFFVPDAPRVGDDGIEDALKKGILRPTTTEDLVAWVEAYIENRESSSQGSYFSSAQEREAYKAKTITMLEEEQDSGDSYVVLGDFTYPSGLYTTYKFFFVPEDVPQPSGEVGHSSVQDLTGKCLSLLCEVNFDKNHPGY